MRKTLMALMFAATLPTIAMAMPPEGPMGGPGGPGFGGPGMHHGKGPMDKLNLTPEQRQKIQNLMGEKRHDRAEITEKYLAKLSAADQKAMKDEIEAKKAKDDAAFRSVLTSEQQKTFDQMQKDREARRAERAEFEAWKAQKAQTTQKTQ